MHEQGAGAVAGPGRAGGAGSARGGRRRRRPGPWPVRPGAETAPAGPARPLPADGRCGAPARRAVGERPAPGVEGGLRAVVKAVLVAVLTAAVVVALGLLADVASAARSPSGVTLTHGDGVLNR